MEKNLTQNIDKVVLQQLVVGVVECMVFIRKYWRHIGNSRLFNLSTTLACWVMQLAFLTQRT